MKATQWIIESVPAVHSTTSTVVSTASTNVSLLEVHFYFSLCDPSSLIENQSKYAIQTTTSPVTKKPMLCISFCSSAAAWYAFAKNDHILLNCLTGSSPCGTKRQFVAEMAAIIDRAQDYEELNLFRCADFVSHVHST